MSAQKPLRSPLIEPRSARRETPVSGTRRIATPVRSPSEQQTPSVAAIMTPRPPCISADLTVDAARLLVLQRGGSLLMVVDGFGAPLGALERSDLMLEQNDDETLVENGRRRPSRHPYELDDEADDVAIRTRSVGQSSRSAAAADETDGGDRSVRDIMVRFEVTLSPEMCVAEAAALLEASGARRAPVVDRQGRLVGLVSASLARLIAGTSSTRTTTGQLRAIKPGDSCKD